MILFVHKNQTSSREQAGKNSEKYRALTTVPEKFR